MKALAMFKENLCSSLCFVYKPALFIVSVALDPHEVHLKKRQPRKAFSDAKRLMTGEECCVCPRIVVIFPFSFCLQWVRPFIYPCFYVLVPLNGMTFNEPLPPSSLKPPSSTSPPPLSTKKTNPFISYIYIICITIDIIIFCFLVELLH